MKRYFILRTEGKEAFQSGFRSTLITVEQVNARTSEWEKRMEKVLSADISNRKPTGLGANYTSYLTFNGVNYDFCFIEKLVGVIATASRGNNITGADEILPNLKKIFKGKVITFDFTASLEPNFVEYIVPLCKTNYGLQKFTSTNGSKRVMAMLKF